MVKSKGMRTNSTKSKVGRFRSKSKASKSKSSKSKSSKSKASKSKPSLKKIDEYLSTDLSKVEDDRGMIAKDISHHGLNDEHPMVKPLLNEVYYVVMKLLYNISALEVRKTERKVMNKNLIV